MANALALVPGNQPLNGHQMSHPLSLVWANVVRQLESGQDHVVLPFSVMNSIGASGVTNIADLLGIHVDSRIITVIDTMNVVYRLLLPPGFKYPGAQPKDVPKQTFESSAASSVAKPKGTGLTPPPPVTLKSTRAQRRARTQPARPMNCFILYRQSKHHDVVKANPGLHNKAISKIIGQMWRAEADSVKAVFKNQADQLANAFHAANPSYVYRPRRPAEVKRRNKKCEPAAPPAQATTGDYYITDSPLDFVDPAVFENQAQSNMNGDEPHLTSDNICPEIFNGEHPENVRPSITIAPKSTYDQHAFTSVVGDIPELQVQAKDNCAYEGSLSGDASMFIGSIPEHRQHFNFNFDNAPAQLPYDEFYAATERNAEYVAQGVLEPYANFTFPEREQNFDFTLLDGLDLGLNTK